MALSDFAQPRYIDKQPTNQFDDSGFGQGLNWLSI